MERFTGLIGIALILGIAFAMSNNRKAINLRTVGVGLALQVGLALFILKYPPGKAMFEWLGKAVTKALEFSDRGAEFVFGSLATGDFIFFFRIIPTIIFVAVLVNIAYHIGLMQIIVQALAKVMHKLMRISGAEALSNIASTFVGQVEAQIMIKPYLADMTRSELMASMTGSFACIAGGVMAAYIKFGVPAKYLIAASIMAAPGALVISKIIFPETEPSTTEGSVKLKVAKSHSNLIEAISAGCSEGLKVGLNVLAMLIGFLALIALLNYGFGKLGGLWGDPLFSLEKMLGYGFSWIAWCMGVPSQDMQAAGSLMGMKLVANEFVAYLNMEPMIANKTISPKTIAIVSFALCGFANLSSIGIQIGGIGELAPSRRTDLAKLGFRALVAGTLASYMSASLVGMIM